MEQLHSNTIETSCKPGKHLTLDERGIIQTLHQQGQTRIFKWVMEHTGFSGSIEHILQSGVQQLMQPLHTTHKKRHDGAGNGIISVPAPSCRYFESTGQ